MTVKKLFTSMVFTPLIIATFAYPIYLNIMENVPFYQMSTLLHFLSMILSHIIVGVGLIILISYTICNCEEDLKSWWSWENLNYYIKEGKSNKYKNRGY